MKSRVFYTAEAKQDLDEIWEYIGDGLNSPKVAERIVDQILYDVELLSFNQLMGVELSAITGYDSDYRYLITGKYLVFYYVDDDEIVIARILHSRRNYLQTLFGDVI